MLMEEKVFRLTNWKSNSGIEFFSSLPSIQARKRSLRLLVFGKELVREIEMVAPRFLCTSNDNPLLATKELYSLGQQLKCLALRGLGLATDVFLLCMGASLNMPFLEQLDLSDNVLGIAGVLHLFTGWMVPRLKEVRLCNTKLRSGENVQEEEQLCNVLVGTTMLKLRLVDVGCNMLADSGVPVLAKHLSINLTLETLLLDENCFSQSSQCILALALAQNVTLR